MKTYKVYETKTGKYTLKENDFVVATIKAKSFEIAKQTNLSDIATDFLFKSVVAEGN